VCGICGIYRFDRQSVVDRRTVLTMARTLRHRGPDDEGVYLDGNLGLAHERLSIIDLTQHGHQPMEYADGNLQLVFNGEIYNFIELREALAARGHTFRSNTDSEVILHLYEEYGEECVDHLNGMFAFAIWDRRRRTLFAARDRFGIKPFYYTVDSDGFAFASEIKALIAASVVKPNLHPPALADYLTFQWYLGGKTLFRGVQRLLPGHRLTVDSTGRVRVSKYWDLDFTVDTDHSESYFERRLAELIEDAVRIQLRADVPVGAHLSGGLDSSLVTCLASHLLPDRISTFTGGFKDGPQYDESGYARLVANAVDSQHFEVFPTAEDFVESMPLLIYYMDEPAAGPGLFPQYFVSTLAANHVKVVLGGQGADEIFGGYARYLIAYLERALRGGIDGSLEDGRYVVTLESMVPNLRQLEGYEPLLRQFWASGLFDSDEARYFRLIDRRGGTRGLVNEEWLPTTSEYDAYGAYCDTFNSGDGKSLINKMSRFDLQTLLPALLQVEDRTSMAASLESRVPILDHRVAELVASMPPMVKFKGGRSKYIFRQVAAGRVPPAISNRTDKMGFPVPLTDWYRSSPTREFVCDTLLGQRARQRGFLRSADVENVLANEEQYGRGVWGILCLELWMQAFLDASSPVAITQ
jgi:asparagine synthase (glutamine-hydrolysing)